MLTLQNVDAYYGKIQALNDISIEVPQGSIVTILGPNGAGKTTTLRTISGLMRPASGSILFQNERLDSLAPHKIVRKGISMVPERREIFNEMTVGENLEMGAFIRRKKVQEVKEDLEWVRELFPVLHERQRSTAGMLSGGQQQMLAIARALMARPRLLLLDEPSLGLAPVLAQEIFNVIERIAREGVTILLVEQNAHLALKVSQYGYVLEAGHIVLAGQSAELLDRDLVRKSYLGELDESSA